MVNALKKFVIILVVLLAALGTRASAQTAAIANFCVTGATPSSTSGLPSTNTLQGIIPSCLVTVFLTGTTNKATIYKDGSNTVLTNPFTAKLDGSFLFFSAINQGYDVMLSGGTIPNVYKSPRTLTGLFPSTQFITTAGNPAGSPGQQQFNNNGIFGGSTVYVLDTASNVSAAINTISTTAQLGITRSLTGSTSVAAGATLNFVAGGMLSCQGNSLTINGAVIAPPNQQIFDSTCAGQVSFSLPQAVYAGWFSTSDWAGGANGALLSLPASPSSKYAQAAGGSIVYLNSYPSGSTTATTFNCNRAVQVIFGAGTYLSTVAPSIYATDPNCDIQGTGSGGQATSATIIRQVSGGLPVYRFQDSSAAFGAQGGGIRLEHIKLDGGDQSGNVIEIGTPSVPATQRNIYSDFTTIGATTGVVVFSTTGLPSGNPSPAQQIWLNDWNCGTDSLNLHQITNCLDLTHGPVIGMWVNRPNLNPLTNCAIIGGPHTSNAWLVQNFVMDDGICEPLGGLSGIGAQGSGIVIGDSASVDIHGMYIESEGSPQLAPPLASFEIGTPPNTDTTCSMSGTTTLTCTDAPFAATDVKDNISVSACSVTSTIASFTNSSNVVLNASGTCGPNAAISWGGGSAVKTSIHNNEVYGFGTTTGMQYAFTVNNPGTFYPNIDSNYTVPTIGIISTSTASSIGTLQNNAGCGTLATNAANGWLKFECASGTGVPYIFTPQLYALPSPSGNIEESWVIDGAGGQFVYVSGASACTNGTQVITFTNGTGSGATANIAITGGLPTGTVQMTNFGIGYTVLPTQGTIATCTGTATFSGGRIVPELNPRFIRDVSGRMSWGTGIAATDVSLARDPSASGQLLLSGQLAVSGLSNSQQIIVGNPGGKLSTMTTPGQAPAGSYCTGITSTGACNSTVLQLPLATSFATTASTSDNVTVTGINSGSHCVLFPTTATAATNIATTYISAVTTNQITVTHTATSGMSYNVLCTIY